MKSTTTTVLVAAALIGGIATAAFMKSGDTSPDSINARTPNAGPRLADGCTIDDGARGDKLDPSAPRGLEYADVLKVDPITEKQKAYATVIGTDPGARDLHHPNPARSLPGRDRAGAPAGA